MYQSILTYCYMVGMIHNMNQPRRINGESLRGSFTVLPFQYDIWLAILIRGTVYLHFLCLDLI